MESERCKIRKEIVQEQVPRFVKWFKIFTKNWPNFSAPTFPLSFFQNLKPSQCSVGVKENLKRRGLIIVFGSLFTEIERISLVPSNYSEGSLYQQNLWNVWTDKFQVGGRKTFHCPHCKMRCESRCGPWSSQYLVALLERIN